VGTPFGGVSERAKAFRVAVLVLCELGLSRVGLLCSTVIFFAQCGVAPLTRGGCDQRIVRPEWAQVSSSR
jgi:hypothetical protein